MLSRTKRNLSQIKENIHQKHSCNWESVSFSTTRYLSWIKAYRNILTSHFFLELSPLTLKVTYKSYFCVLTLVSHTLVWILHLPQEAASTCCQIPRALKSWCCEVWDADGQMATKEKGFVARQGRSTCGTELCKRQQTLERVRQTCVSHVTLQT